MPDKKFIDFHNIHTDRSIVVCGCGTSLLDFKEHHTDFITIGVNDVPALFEPSYLLVTDTPVRFHNDRRRAIVNNSKSEYLFTCSNGWKHPNIVRFNLGSRGFANLDNPNKVDHFLNSPYVGINIAYKMGAKNIAITGVDFTDGHFYSPKDGEHSLSRMRYMSDINYGYRSIFNELKKRGVNLYNLSKNSKLTMIPYIDVTEFKKL